MGMQVDPLTLLPMESVHNAKVARKAEEEATLEGLVGTGMTVEDKLGTPEGQFFIGLIVKLLETRIDQLVEGDVQSQTILRVLSGLGHDITAGRSAAERLAKSRLRFKND